VLAVPLQARHHIFGVLAVGDVTGRIFTETDVQVVEAFADQAAIALENARVFGEAEHGRKAAESLADLERLISRSLDHDEVAQQAAASLGMLLGARSASVFRIDGSGETLRMVAGWGETANTCPPGQVFSIHGSLAGEAVLRGVPAATTSVLTDATVAIAPEVRALLDGLGDQALLAVPLVVQGRVTGAMSVLDVRGRAWHERDIGLAETFAHHAAFALEHARLHSEMATQLRQTQALQGRLEALVETSRELSKIQPLEALLTRITDACRRLLDAPLAGLRVIEGTISCWSRRLPRHRARSRY
jgi:GAF domain-containing protein